MQYFILFLFYFYIKQPETKQNTKTRKLPLHKPQKLEQLYKETTTLRTVNNRWVDILSFKDQCVLEFLPVKFKKQSPSLLPQSLFFFTIMKQP